MFYEQLKKACENNNKTVTSIAVSLEISRSNVTNWKNGTMPSGDIIVRISELLNVSCDYLLTGKEYIQSDYPDDIQKIINNLIKLDISDRMDIYANTALMLNGEKYIKTTNNLSIG